MDLRILQGVKCLLLLILKELLVLFVLGKFFLVNFVELLIRADLYHVSFVLVLLHPRVRELGVCPFLVYYIGMIHLNRT